jgi:hypothetical protein
MMGIKFIYTINLYIIFVVYIFDIASTSHLQFDLLIFVPLDPLYNYHPTFLHVIFLYYQAQK